MEFVGDMGPTKLKREKSILIYEMIYAKKDKWGIY